MKKRILFLVNGYGLGNSTRIHSIIQNLNKNYFIDIFAYGNSFNYFKKVSEIDNLFMGTPLGYGLKNGQINFFETIKLFFKNIDSIYKSRKIIKEILHSYKYHLIVSDSNFSALFLRKRPKLISINNSDVLLKRSLKTKKSGAYVQFFIECLDYIYNFLVPDLVISPFFEDYRNTKKIQHTSLIVRKEFKDSAFNFKKHHALIMTGGADVFNKSISIFWNHDHCNLSVLGDQIQISGKIKKEPKTLNTSSLISQSTILVINGGFSSISESLATKKPMIIIPLKGHMEQRINALWIQKSKMGLISSWKNLEDSILYIIKNYDFFKKNLLNYKHSDGGKQVASILIKEIEK